MALAELAAMAATTPMATTAATPPKKGQHNPYFSFLRANPKVAK
jgi:hypothetical protein